MSDEWPTAELSARSTERYLHTLPDSDDRTLAAFSRIRDGEVRGSGDQWLG